MSEKKVLLALRIIKSALKKLTFAKFNFFAKFNLLDLAKYKFLFLILDKTFYFTIVNRFSKSLINNIMTTNIYYASRINTSYFLNIVYGL